MSKYTPLINPLTNKPMTLDEERRYWKMKFEASEWRYNKVMKQLASVNKFYTTWKVS